MNIKDSIDNSLIPIKSKTLTHEEIEVLHASVNDGSRYYIDPSSVQYADRIIELWFEGQGYDFWNNPYPEVTEWEFKNGNLTFKYT